MENHPHGRPPHRVTEDKTDRTQTAKDGPFHEPPDHPDDFSISLEFSPLLFNRP